MKILAFDAETDADSRAGWQHPFLNFRLSAFSWCLHCQKAHHTSTWKEKEWQCPGCGHSPADLWRWEQVRAVQTLFPPVPQEGRFYSVYGPVAAGGDGRAAAVAMLGNGQAKAG